MASGALWGPHPKKHRFLPLRHSLFREICKKGAGSAGPCICKMKVDTHKSVGVYFFVVEYKEKDVGLWAKKEHAIESIAKMRK